MPEDTARYFLSPDDPFSGSQVPFPDGTFAFTICTTAERMLAMMSVLFEGGAVMDYGYIGEHNVDVIEALANWNNPPCAETVTPEEKQDIFDGLQAFSSGFLDCDDDCEEDEMACSKPVKIGGQWYLQVDCGCAESQFFALTPALLDENGDPVSPAFSGEGTSSGSGPSGAWDFGGVSDSNLNCYGNNATSYLLTRVIEFAHAIIDFSTAGISVFSQLDEYLEVAKLITLLVTGDDDVAQIEALTKSAVTAAFNDPIVTAPLAAAWNYTGRVTKNDLQAWIKASPWNASNGVPVRLIMGQWIANSWLAGISGDLAVLASECESGNPLPATLPSVGNLLQSNDWAVSFDLTVAPFVENAWFVIRLDDGNPIGEWIEGVGYKARPNILEEPHAATRLTLDFIQGSGGDCAVAYVDYEYVPLLVGSTARLQDVFDTSYDEDAEWNGIREVDTTGWSSGSRDITLRPYRELNDTVADGGTGIVRRIAMAGSGANPFSGLVQDFS